MRLRSSAGLSFAEDADAAVCVAELDLEIGVAALHAGDSPGVVTTDQPEDGVAVWNGFAHLVMPFMRFSKWAGSNQVEWPKSGSVTVWTVIGLLGLTGPMSPSVP